MNNYDIVTLILTKPESIALLYTDKVITKEEIRTALEYIKDQELLTSQGFEDKVDFIKETMMLLYELHAAFNAGMSIDELRAALYKSKELAEKGPDNEEHS